MHPAALVGLDESIDWLYLPRFDSPSVFGAILDGGKGGRFRIAPAAGGELRHKQFYWPDTNVLITRSLHPDGIAEVEDYMPVEPGAIATQPADASMIEDSKCRGLADLSSRRQSISTAPTAML